MKEALGFSICVCSLLVLAPLVLSEHPKFEQCKNKSAKYFGLMNKIARKCHADIKDEKLSFQENFEKFGCTVKCIMKEDKMLDDNEMVTDDIIKTTAKEKALPEFQDKLLGMLTECKTKYGDKLDKNDALCKSYKDYGMCMQEAIAHVCYENP